VKNSIKEGIYMKNKKIVILVTILIILMIAITITSIIIIDKTNTKKIEEVFNRYISYINEKNYDEMYEKLSSKSKNSITKENFIARNKNIYEGIDSLDIKTNIQEIEKNGNSATIKYEQEMYTSAGKVQFSNTINLYKEQEYKIDWTSEMIFPGLKEEYKIRVETIKSKRGSILDRNGTVLASDGTASYIGLVPGKIGDNKDETINKVAQLLNMSEETINGYLSASYVKEDTFVPLKKIAYNQNELKQQLLRIPGIQINSTPARVYTLGEEAAHLIGYVQAINAEELEKNQDKGYNTNSLIGKIGLEQIYEDKLKGTDGTRIYMTDEKGNEVKQLAIQNKKDGEDIKLTIDSSIQKKLYEQLKSDKGLFVVMQPKTGELLALISTPSYNSNDFSLGMSNAKWQELNNNDAKPLYNRFVQSYCPGSTFKPIIGAIGLSTGKIDENEDFGHSGVSWQKDSSWGDYKVTTLTAYSGKKNLLNGLIHSDNIYFAQAALKIGESTLVENFKKIGFNEQIDFPFTLSKSKYSNGDDNKIGTEGKIADTGFGQGNILVNPIHMASIYSAFVNDGNMIKPILEYQEKQDELGQILKKEAFTKEAANVIKEALIQVVENPEGTANDMKISGQKIAGKTGTAELKKDANDNQSGTLGWFDCFNITDDKDKQVLVIGMVENIQNNSDGGSHYLIKKIRTIF